MLRFNFKILMVGVLFSTSVYFSSCKGKSNDTTNNTDTAVIAPPPTTTAPVEVAADDAITTGVRDATKDYPGVNATVTYGEITLTGTIERSKLPDLMQRLNSLRPKKINNQLTIK
jgi:hypothetical protein